MKLELLVSLLRHWTWAARERELFEQHLGLQGSALSSDAEMQLSFFTTETGIALCLWLALLYVTCEGLEENAGISVDGIAPGYSEIAGRLKQFRNASFHVQSRYWSPKLLSILTDSEALSTIRLVHDAVGGYLGVRLLEHQRGNEQ